MFYLKFAKIILMKISACIITHNEEKNIRAALESVSWADEIIVVDSESSDATGKIAESMGARVIVQKWMGFGKQKQFAIEKASYNWIFSLDADEQVSKELKQKILQLKNLSGNDLAKGYKIKRLTYYMNRPIMHGNWYPDWQLRFFHRDFGRWNEFQIHESVTMNSDVKVKKLAEHILHYSNINASKHHHLIGTRYAPLAAQQMLSQGKRTTKAKIITTCFVTFFQSYFIKLGFLDGFPGFCIAFFAAYHSYLKHLLLWELQNNLNDQEIPALNLKG